MSQQVAGANAPWRVPFRFAVHGFWSGVAQFVSLDGGGRLRRSDLFIVQASQKNRPEPHRGGMSRGDAAHAAPPGLGRTVERGVTINRSPRWGVARVGSCATRPNQTAALDGGRPVLFAFQARRPTASEPQRWAMMRAPLRAPTGRRIPARGNRGTSAAPGREPKMISSLFSFFGVSLPTDPIHQRSDLDQNVIGKREIENIPQEEFARGSHCSIALNSVRRRAGV